MRNIAFLSFLLFFSIVSHSQKILFIGNSLTYSNNMPFILEEIGKSFDKKISTKMICKPNYAIIDHLNEGMIQKEIASKNYDYVIIQQGPSSQEEGRKMLFRDGKIIKKLCKKHTAKFGYFMVWPSKKYYFTFDRVIKNHKEAAEKNNAILFDVGSIWKQYQKSANYVSLYGSDQFHPSKTGSFLAALTIFNKLFPNENLKNLSFKKVSSWITNKKSYDAIVQLLTQ